MPTRRREFYRGPEEGGGLYLSSTLPGDNLIRFSEEMGNAAWNQKFSMGTVGNNAVLAPDKTLTADLLQTNSGTSIHFHRQNLTRAAGAAEFTFSVYLKQVDITTSPLVYLGVFNGSNEEFGIRINLETGALDQIIETNLATLEASQAEFVGDGWYRVAVTGLHTFGTTVGATLHMGDPSQVAFTSTYLGVPAFNRVYAWGAQLEAGRHLTPYSMTV